jgi:hypothetical protein
VVPRRGSLVACRVQFEPAGVRTGRRASSFFPLHVHSGPGSACFECGARPLLALVVDRPAVELLRLLHPSRTSQGGTRDTGAVQVLVRCRLLLCGAGSARLDRGPEPGEETIPAPSTYSGAFSSAAPALPTISSGTRTPGVLRP